MTREDAIYEIKQLAVLSANKNIERITEALNMAIEALQDESRYTEQTEPCPEYSSEIECGSCKYPQTDCAWK